MFKYIFSIILAFIIVGLIGYLSYNKVNVTVVKSEGSGQETATPSSTPVAQNNTSFKFTDDHSELIDLKRGTTQITITYNGNSNGNSDFSASLKKPDLSEFEILENRTGSFTDTKEISVPETGVYMLTVHTQGDWSFSQK